MDLAAYAQGNLVRVWGRNAVVGTAVEDLYQYDQAIDWYTTLGSGGSTLAISSSSTNDAAAGTGARKVTIHGLGTNGQFLSETVTMNGQSVVSTVASFIDVFGADVTETGTGAANAGDIHIIKTGTGGTYTNGVPGTITSGVAKIMAGWQTAMNGHWRVPKGGGTYMLTDICASSYTQSAALQVTVRNPTSATDPGQHVACVFGLGSSGHLQVDASVGELVIGSEQSIHLRAIGASASAVVHASMVLRKTS